MYNLRFAKAEQTRKAITNQQLQQIRNMYQEIADQYSRRIEYLSNKTNISSILRIQYLREYQKQLADELGKVNRRIESNIKSGMTKTAEAVLEEEIKRAKELGFVGITGKYSNIPTDVVETIISGQLYQGDWSLSSAIWGTNEKIKRDCQSIVARGIAQNKGVYEVAKDLEAYVNPQARKTYRWAKDYPGSTKVIDYNASRLARTMMSHAYQEAFERSTEKDPWVDAYKWNISANDRVCPLCIGRAENDEYGLGEGIYPKGEVPLDHPNGQCYLTIVQTKSTNDVVNDLANWYNGTGDESMNGLINDFAYSLGYTPEMLKKTVVDKNTSVFSFTNANDYVKSTMQNVANKYNDVFGLESKIKNVVMNEKDFEGLMSGTYAYVKNDDITTLYINPNIFKSNELFMQTIGGRIRAYHKNASAESIFAHELSHSVGSSIGDVQYAAIDNAVDEFMKSYTKTAMDVGLADWQIAGEYISRYAVTTKEEFFAEAFADVYQNGDRAEGISKNVVKYVKEHVK